MILKLTKDILIQLLGIPEFYEEVPAFLPLRDKALACYDEYQRVLAGKPCPGCTARSLMRPALLAFTNLLEDVSHEDRQALKAFIGKRRKETPVRVEFIYKSEGVVREFSF